MDQKQLEGFDADDAILTSLLGDDVFESEAKLVLGLGGVLSKILILRMKV